MKKLSLILVMITLLFFDALNVNAFDIPSVDAALVIEDDGELFDTTTKGYTETGVWQEAGRGFENRVIKVSEEADAQAKWKLSPSMRTYYDVYYWNAVVDGGDPDALLTIYATGTSQGTCKIDFSKGTAQWLYAGTYYPSDGALNITISGSGNGKIIASQLRYVKTTQEKFYAFRDGASGGNASEIVLTIGSTQALVDGRETTLTMGHPEIVNNRTMIPLRFVSETMGAEVLWNENERKVTINGFGKTIEFFVGKNIYMIDGVKNQMDVEPYIKEDRTYIPVRFYAESTGKFVTYDNQKVTIKSE